MGIPVEYYKKTHFDIYHWIIHLLAQVVEHDARNQQKSTTA